MKKIIVILVIINILTGCDPKTSYTKFIHNESNQSVWVVFYPWAGRGLPLIAKDSILIIANKDIYLRGGGGGLYGNPPCISSTDDSLVLRVKDAPSLKISVDLNKESTWYRKSSGSSAKGYIIECKAIIKQTDIVPK